MRVVDIPILLAFMRQAWRHRMASLEFKARRTTMSPPIRRAAAPAGCRRGRYPPADPGTGTPFQSLQRQRLESPALDLHAELRPRPARRQAVGGVAAWLADGIEGQAHWRTGDGSGRALDERDGHRLRARHRSGSGGRRNRPQDGQRRTDQQGSHPSRGIEPSFSSGRRHPILRRPRRSYYNVMIRETALSRIDLIERRPVTPVSLGVGWKAPGSEPSPCSSPSRCTAASRVTVATWRAAGRKTIDADEHRSGGAPHLVARPRGQAIQDPAAQLTGDEGPIDRPAGCREPGDPHHDRRPSTHAVRVAPLWIGAAALTSTPRRP